MACAVTAHAMMAREVMADAASAHAARTYASSAHAWPHSAGADGGVRVQATVTGTLPPDTLYVQCQFGTGVVKIEDEHMTWRWPAGGGGSNKRAVPMDGGMGYPLQVCRFLSLPPSLPPSLFLSLARALSLTGSLASLFVAGTERDDGRAGREEAATDRGDGHGWRRAELNGRRRGPAGRALVREQAGRRCGSGSGSKWPSSNTGAKASRGRGGLRRLARFREMVVGPALGLGGLWGVLAAVEMGCDVSVRV
eukprot:1718451-Rhodomonas_salina.3